MDEITAVADQQAELSGLLDGMGADDWHRPSPCEGWDVADVLLHLCQTNEMAVASAEGRLDAWLTGMTAGLRPGQDVDDGAALMVERERGAPAEALVARWHEGAAAIVAALRAGDPHERVDWVAGQLSLRTLTATRLAETWIHTTDVASGLGVDLAPTGRLELIARLAWRTLPYAFTGEGRMLSGPVAFELTGPAGEAWTYASGEPPTTVVRGLATELCGVAARRVDPAATSLETDGPDGDAVLALVRTYA
jgi:uncharacterized protein (TIGR03084 family)